MVTYTTGDILSSDTEAIINTVNCKGVMGAGLALQFKKKYPQNYQSYKKACKKNTVKIGQMYVYEISDIFGRDKNPRWIINFPTKDDWKNKSEINYIRTGLSDLRKVINQYQIKSIIYL